MSQATKTHQRLIAEIRKLDRAYHEEAQPLVSDQEYDRLYRELIDLEAAHPELPTTDSPSQRVGGAPLPHFTAVAHALPMQSLDNTYSATELEAFVDRIQKTLDGEKLDFVIEPKIDGVAVSIRYEKGRFVQGLTRGDGQKGDAARFIIPARPSRSSTASAKPRAKPPLPIRAMPPPER
jgi:DNA ligase (NAD+)